ncbi:hypothetical protein EB822_06515 [Flavobacteriaceae bacterium PRS1]|jgi:uncharacterized membrane protein|nr:hypothetical protein EB822_06515 [Flavobacteriaceae bacterium PRS1]
METSILIAKILATVYFSFFLGLLFSSKYYKKELPKLVDNSAYLILGGYMAIVFGFLILEFHNYWNSDWTVIITIFGWLSLLKGIILIVFPQMFTAYKTTILKTENQKYILILLLILGVFFGYFGFFTP